MDLNRFTLTGLLMWAGGGCVLLFQLIASAMEKPEFTDLVLGDFGYDIWVAVSDRLPAAMLQNGFDYLVFEMKLWVFLVCFGTLCIILGMFMKK